MASLKIGTIEDLSEVIRLSMAFFEASPYSKLGVSDNRVRDLCATFLRGDADKLCLLLVDGDQVLGCIAAVAVQNIFNDRWSTIEQMWWIDPEHRGLGNANQMLEAYEYWATYKVNAQVIQLVNLVNLPLDKLYTRRGYEKHEEAWLKVL